MTDLSGLPTLIEQAQFIDSCIKSGCVNDSQKQTIAEYLFYICRAIAVSAKFFRDSKDYEDFPIYASGHYYNRLFNDYHGPSHKDVEDVDNIWGYIKKTIRFVKLDYQRLFFFDDRTFSEDDITKDNIKYFNSYFNDGADNFKKLNFQFGLDDIDSYIDEFVSKNTEWFPQQVREDISTSLKLTLLNNITFNLQQQKSLQSENKDMNKQLNDMYSNTQYRYYRLSDEYKPLVKVLFHRLLSFLFSSLTSTLDIELVFNKYADR